MPPKKKGATKRKTKAAAKNKEEQEEEEEIKAQEIEQVVEIAEVKQQLDNKPPQPPVEEAKEELSQHIEEGNEEKSSNLVNLKPQSSVIAIKSSTQGTTRLTEKQLREIRFNSGKANQINTLGIKEDYDKTKSTKESQLKVNYPGVRVNLGCTISPQDRMKRFGAMPKQSNDDLQDKKRLREERFGIVSKETDLDKRKKRIQRFGEDSYFDALKQAR